MSIRRSHTSTADVLGRMIFPEIQPIMRRKHLRFLMLSLVLASLFCALFGWLILTLQK